MLKAPSISSAIALATLFSQASAHIERVVHEPLKITRAQQSVIFDSVPSNPYPAIRRRDTEESSAATWSWPVSYRVAIVLNVFVFMVTLAALFVLAVYIRKQYLKKKMLGLMRPEEDVGLEEDAIERGHVRVQRRKMGTVTGGESLTQAWDEKKSHQRSWSEDSEWESKFGNRTSVVSFAGSSRNVSGK